MDDYISREAVLELVVEKQKALCPAGRYGRGYVYGRDRYEYDVIEADIDAIENIPASDVVRIVHAKWIEEPNRIFHWHCSNCGYVVGIIKMDCDYCPKCGAIEDLE